jgi:Lon protease-like protein
VNIALPQEIGVMALPAATLFPGGIVPLHIFEPRYRLMLEKTLETHRMFALAHTTGAGAVRPIGGVGIVRACVKNPDGTSNLMLQGVSRVRIVSIRDAPYPMAAIEPVAEIKADAGHAEELRRKILARCEAMKNGGHELPPQFGEYVAGIPSHGAFCDVVASIALTRPDTRQKLLEELDVDTRMVRLLAGLREENGDL